MPDLVLLVEDSEDDVELFLRACKKVGIANPIQSVGDGDEAVTYLLGQGRYTDRRAHPLPGLVLLDLKLPRRSGLEVLGWIRQQAGLRRLPVVVFTSSRETSDIDRAYDLGANSYLVKPVDSENLSEVVRSICGYWLTLNQRPNLGGAA